MCQRVAMTDNDIEHRARARLAADAAELEQRVQAARQTYEAAVEAAAAQRDAVFLEAARFGWSFRRISRLSRYAHQSLGSMVRAARLREAARESEQEPSLREAA